MDVRAQERLAFEAQKAGNFNDAARLWQEILAEYPRWEHGQAHYLLADCYVELGKLDEAEEAYRQAVAIAPEDDMFREALESLVEARGAGLI